MIATLATVRSLAIAVLAVASATLAFRPTHVEEVSIGAEIRSEVDHVHVRQRDVRVDEDRDAMRRQAIEAIMSYQPIGCQMRADTTAFAAPLAP